MCTVIHSVEKLRVEPMTAKAGSRGHVRWAGRMTSCVMTHFFFFDGDIIIKNQIKKCKCAQRKKTKKKQHIHNRKQGKKLCLKDWIMYACVYDVFVCV